LKVAYLGLGTNLGDRAANLRDAIQRLTSAECRVTRQSSIYETEPRDVLDQPWFLNQVIEIETTLFPMQLLARVQRIEREMGRKPMVAKGPRLIDIDILLFGSATVSSPDLEIPHPRMWQRRFVLEPLAELVPDRRDVQKMLKSVAGQVVRKL